MADVIQTKPKKKKEILQDLALSYAWRIANGEGGGNYIYCLEEDKFYIYENGAWVQIHEKEMLSRVCKHKIEITKFTLPMRKQILENYKIIRYKTLKEFNTTDLLNLQNYMVDARGMNVLKHSENYYSTIQLPYKYDQIAKCDIWFKTLNEIFENDQKKINLLQEFFGYCLVPDMEQKKSLLLLGESDTGKSTILFILRALLGHENCSSVPLEFLSNPQYTPMMVNKLVNIDADVDKNASKYEAQFKMVTSGEPINCNQKFIETFEFIPKCKIILAANIFPKITDHSSAFYKRLILIPCDRIFDESEKDRTLVPKIKQELPGILNWAIQGLIRLKTRGMFEQHDFMKDAVQELEDENNPVNAFFEEYIDTDVSGDVYIEKSELFEKYKKWCTKNEQYNLSHLRFAACVFKRFHKFTPKDCRLSNNGPRVWKNIKYIQFKNVKQQQDMGWDKDSVAA